MVLHVLFVLPRIDLFISTEISKQRISIVSGLQIFLYRFKARPSCKALAKRTGK